MSTYLSKASILAMMVHLPLTSATPPSSEWDHLMTINPSDGQDTWFFNSKYWYDDDFGFADTGKDFISDKVRHKKMHMIHIESMSNQGHIATKTWTLSPQYDGWTFYEIMANSFNAVITGEPEASVPSGFENCPIMNISGPLKVNKISATDGCRLMSSDQYDPPVT